MTSMVVQVSTGPSTSSCPTMEALNINIYSPRSLTRVDSDDDSETSCLESDSSALVMLKDQIRELDTILQDLNVTSTTSDNNDDDEMKQELCTLSFQEKMLKQEMDMIDDVISHTSGTTIDNDSSQDAWKERFGIEPQDGEMDFDWQQEPETELEEHFQEKMLKQEMDMIDDVISHTSGTTIDNESSQDVWKEQFGIEPQDGEIDFDWQQEPETELEEHFQEKILEHTIIRKELTQETHEGGYRHTTEEAEIDTDMNTSTHGPAPSLCGVCYDGIFGVQIIVVPKNHSQFLAIPADPVPFEDDTRQVAHHKEDPVCGDETRERANSDDPTLDTLDTLDTSSKSDVPANEEQDQCIEDERAPHARLDVLRSEDTEENDDEETSPKCSQFPSLDHVISDIASDAYECSAYSEATFRYLCSAFRTDIPISPVRTKKNITIEGIPSQMDGSISKELLSNGQSQYTDGKDGSIITSQICRSDDDDDDDRDEYIITPICRSDDKDDSIITSQICRSESGGGDGSQTMKMTAQETANSKIRCHGSNDSSRNVLLEKEAMELINLALSTAIDDDVIDPDQAGEAKAGYIMSALEYELQFGDSLFGSSSHLGTFDASEQVSAQMSPSPSPSDAGTFDASEQLTLLLAVSQPPGCRIDEARRRKIASLTALEYEMQFSEDGMQLCSPTDEASLMKNSFDEDPKEITYRESVCEVRTKSILDLASQDTAPDNVREDPEEVESNESYVFLESPLETPTSEDSVDIPMIVRHKPEPKIGVDTRRPYEDIVSFEPVDPLENPASEDSIDIPMIVRYKPEPMIKVGNVSFEAVEDVPSDELPVLDQQDNYLSPRPRYGASESFSDAPSDEMQIGKSAGDTDNAYYSEENDPESDLEVLEVKIKEMEMISAAAVNRFVSSSKVIAESVSNETSVEVAVESDCDSVAVDTKEPPSTVEANQSERGNAIAESVSNEASVEVSVESDGDTVITRIQSRCEVTNDAVDTKELASTVEANQSEQGNAIAESFSNEASVEVSVESDGDTVITRIQSRCEVTNDAVDTKELASTGKVSENDRKTDCVNNLSKRDNKAAIPKGTGSRDPLGHFPSLKEALSAKSTGRRKKEVRYVKEARSPLRFIFGCSENTSATESEVATVLPEDTVAVTESGAIDGSTENRYFSWLYCFVTSVTCGRLGDSEVDVQAAEPNMEIAGQPDSNESSERSQIKNVRASAQKDEQDHSGILNAMSYRSYMESVREVKRELAGNTGKARLVFETEEEREIEAVLSDKLWLLGESVSVASSTNTAFATTTLPNDVRDDDGLDIRSWDRQARELLQQNELLLQSMANFDFASYQKCVADDVTGIDAGSKGESAKRKEFHQYCFDSSGLQTDPATVSIVSPNIRFLSPDAAITSYTRIDQFIRDGKPEMIQTSETRVWQNRGERWVNCHFHQS